MSKKKELQGIVDRVNKSEADFVKRLLDAKRATIKYKDGTVGTHKLSWFTDDKGAVVYPEIQNIGDRLIDFSLPPYSPDAGINSAINRGDTVRMSPREAELFTQYYKDFYPGFNKYNLGGYTLPPVGITDEIKQKANILSKIPITTKAPDIGGKASGIASGISGVLGAATSAASLADTTGIQNNINTQAGTTSNASTTDSLLSNWSNHSFLNDVSYKDVRGKGLTAGGALTGIASGAAAGATFGPIGAIIGGAVGGISTAIGGIIGNAKARRKQEELNRQAHRANMIALDAFSRNADNIENNMDNRLEQNFFAFGGFSDPFTSFQEGGTHEQNPMHGIPIGIGANGLPNLAEEGETRYNNYIFSDRITANKELLGLVHLPTKYEGKSLADISKELRKESKERPYDPISNAGLEDSMAKLQVMQEFIKAKKEKFKLPTNEYADGGYLSYLRYAPALGGAIGTITDTLGITNKPDYSAADSLSGIIKPHKVEVNPLTDFVDYVPFDREYYANRLASQSRANARNVVNTAGTRSSALAGLLASDYNSQLGLANLYRQTEEQNYANRLRAAEFNRGTRMHNNELAFRVGAVNRQDQDSLLRLATLQAQMREAERLRAEQNRSAHISGMLQGLGDIGREQYMLNLINTNPALFYKYSGDGSIKYK